MKQRMLALMIVLVLLVALAGPVQATPESTLNLIALPNPIIAGSTVNISWDMDLATGGTLPRFRLFIPSDWYDATDWSSGTGVTITGLGAITWSDYGTPCTGVVIVGVNTICNEWVADVNTESIESITASFTVTGTAVVGANRPIRVVNTAGSGGTPNLATIYVPVTSNPTVIYASDQANCGGYGIAGTSCFPSLKAAYDRAVAYNAPDLVIVGDLTVNPGTEANITSTLTLIRETATGRLVAGSACTNNTLLTLAKNNLTVRGLTVVGAACTGAATGITVDSGGGVTLDNVTVRNFSNGTGLLFTGTGAGTLINSKGSITANAIGVDDASSGAISLGTGSTDGNTISNNTRGVRTDGGITLKGNDISGGTYGVELLGAPTAFYGNRITGASVQQVYCNGVTTGAAWNYLGGTSPASGSNCTDVESQLGSDFVSWSDGGVVSGLTVTGTVIATFDLANNLPFNYGSTTGRTSNYFAVYAGGAVPVGVLGTGVYQYKMLVPPNTGGVCPTGTEFTCWESVGNGRAQEGSGYYYKGSLDPTAITLTDLSATPHAETNWLWLILIVAAGFMLSGAWWLRRQARHAD